LENQANQNIFVWLNFSSEIRDVTNWSQRWNTLCCKICL
jgi:hypothetical protein